MKIPMSRSMLHRLPIFSRRFHQGADARMMGQPRDSRKGAQWLAGWDEGDELINRVKQRAAVETSHVRKPVSTGVGQPGEYERNGSSVDAFFVTFAFVFVACFPAAMLTKVVFALPEPFSDDWPSIIAIGAFLGLICGLWQAEIACLPRGNAAGKKLWWQ